MLEQLLVKLFVEANGLLVHTHDLPGGAMIVTVHHQASTPDVHRIVPLSPTTILVTLIVIHINLILPNLIPDIIRIIIRCPQ